jgi:ketosteroid isomerase-like protein
MRSVAFAVLPLLACSGATPPAAAPDTAAASRDVAAVLDDWHDAAAHADEARYFAHFAPDGVFLGTDATERWDVPAFRAYAHPRFAEGRAWTFHSTARHVAFSADGRIAWFDESLATERLGPARGSGVLVRSAAGWLIAQYNLTLTIPNERFASVKKVLETP